MYERTGIVSVARRDINQRLHEVLITFSKWTDINQKVENWKLGIDRHTCRYIHNPEEKCHNGGIDSVILLVIFVNSAPGHKERRNYIRHTLGNYSAWSRHNGRSVMRIVFLLGAVNDSAVQADIDQESRIYDDIVQEDFIDDYLNLTRKTVMGLKWVSTFCRRAKYTMSMDDDVLLNAPRLLSILRENTSPNLTLGNVLKMKPLRSPLEKHYTPKRVYPKDTYPPYFQGYAYVLSMNVAEMVYHTALETNILPWADVFIGECMHQLKIHRTHSPVFGVPAIQLSRKSSKIMRHYLTVYHISREASDQLWAIWTNDG